MTMAIAAMVVAVSVAAARAPAATSASKQPSAAAGKDTDVFEATWYLGEAVDTFAPNQVASYRNPAEAGSIETRFITGANFEYRMVGRKHDGVQLWFFGETLHGVRSVDVNCTPEPPKQPPPICGNGSFSDQSLYLIRNASSLEAFFGPRLDFYTLQRDSDAPASLYVTARFGFVAVKDAPQVYATHHVGMGLRMPDGVFAGSQVEVGWGNNEMMVNSSWNRLKIDGTLAFDIASGWKDEVPYLKNWSARSGSSFKSSWTTTCAVRRATACRRSSASSSTCATPLEGNSHDRKPAQKHRPAL